MVSTNMQIILILCHLFIQIFWTFTSRGRNVESFLKTWTHTRSIPIVIFEIIGFAQIALFPRLTFPISAKPIFFLAMIGLTISVTGTVLAAWAKIAMGTNWGRPAQHDRIRQSQLVTGGPFRYSRNPIYVGLFLLFFGQQLALQSYGVLLSFIFALAIRQAVHTEEPLLEKYFGNAYLSYKKRVPRYL